MTDLATARSAAHSPDHDAAWQAWARSAEDMLGHALDGNQEGDGYSLDGAFAAFSDGASVVEYALDVIGRR